MTALDIDAEREVGSRLPRVNWGLVAAVLTVLGWLLAASSGAFGDYRKTGDRVTVLETQRANDTDRMERIESKLDRLLERIRP
jgi:predicted RNA binding protein YcfA (HicA-like mRNA interferase family)